MTDASPDPVAIATRFLDAFNRNDLSAMRAALADDAVAFVTGPDGRPTPRHGGNAYVAAIAAMDLPSAEYTVSLTQDPIRIDADRVLVMVEVRARRDDRALHNFAAHLLRIADGRVAELHMVEAKPAESDAFWSI